MNKSNLVIGGDFNCVNDWNDRTKQKLDKSSEVLTKLKSKHNLTDIWRQIHPDKKSYTFIDPSRRDSNSRIDFFLCCNIVKITSTEFCKDKWEP